MSLFFFLKSGNSDTYTLALNGTSVIAITVGKAATAKIKIDNDGSVYKDEDDGGGYTQVSSLTNWVRPAAQAPGDFECRVTNVTGDTPTLTAAEDTWYALSSGDYEATIADGVSDGTEKTCTFDIEIRKGSSGSAEVSAEYTLYAEYS